MVTLSVSSSTNGSSTATASPAFLNQRPMVASVTDSPSVGTRISVMVFFLDNLCGQKPRVSSSANAEDPVFRDGRDQNDRRGVLDTPLSRGMTDQFSASSNSALSCARCFDIKPVAGAADAARPA